MESGAIASRMGAPALRPLAGAIGSAPETGAKGSDRAGYKNSTGPLDQRSWEGLLALAEEGRRPPSERRRAHRKNRLVESDDGNAPRSRLSSRVPQVRAKPGQRGAGRAGSRARCVKEGDTWSTCRDCRQRPGSEATARPGHDRHIHCLPYFGGDGSQSGSRGSDAAPAPFDPRTRRSFVSQVSGGSGTVTLTPSTIRSQQR